MRSDAAGPDISAAYRKTHTFWQRDAAFTGSVTYSQPARTRWSHPTVYRAHRRCRLLAVALALVLAITAGQLINDAGYVRTPPVRRRNARRTDVSAVSLAQQGQAALLGNAQRASPR
jgi:hypothetical protein